MNVRPPARALAAAVAFAVGGGPLGGCAPVVDLAQPRSPYSYVEPPRVVEPPPPDPDGPCIQRTSRRRQGTWLWKHGQLVRGGIADATRDFPEANAIARAGQARSRASLPLFILGGVLQLGFMATLVAVTAEDTDGLTKGLALGGALTATWSMLGTAIAVSTAGFNREQRAMTVYNRWAADHGCSNPPITTTAR